MFRLAVFAFLVSAQVLSAEEMTQVPATEPKLVSILPVGGQQGTTFEAEITGKQLQGAYAVWFEDEQLTATIEQIIQVEKKKESNGNDDEYEQKGDQPDYRARLTIRIPPEAAPGLHPFRLVTKRGVSNALFLQVVAESVVAETVVAERADLAQPLTIPVVVNGRLAEKGEEDFYSLQVSQGEELLFEQRLILGMHSQPLGTWQTEIQRRDAD